MKVIIITFTFNWQISEWYKNKYTVHVILLMLKVKLLLSNYDFRLSQCHLFILCIQRDLQPEHTRKLCSWFVVPVAGNVKTLKLRSLLGWLMKGLKALWKNSVILSTIRAVQVTPPHSATLVSWFCLLMKSYT